MLNHNYIGTEHILLGLIHEGEGIAAAKDFNCVIEKFDFGWHISNIPTIRMVSQLSCGLSRKRSFSAASSTSTPCSSDRMPRYACSSTAR
mgnify:CR=1 FL=1